MGKKLIEPQTAVAFEMAAGQTLTIQSPMGGQVANLVLFNQGNVHEQLSSGKSVEFERTVRFTEGHHLWSNMARPMANIAEDSYGHNDFLQVACCKESFRQVYGEPYYHINCQDNLVKALASFGVDKQQVTIPFKPFMTIQYNENGSLENLPSQSKPSDRISFYVMMDSIVGVSACPAPDCNNQTFKHLEYKIS